MRHPICQVQRAEIATTESGLPCLTLELHGGVGFTFVLTPELADQIKRALASLESAAVSALAALSAQGLGD